MYEQKIVDFKGIETKGTREIVPIDPRKFSTYSFRCYRDPKSGTFYGIQIGVDKEGNPKFRQISISGRREYELSNPEEAKEYYLVKNCPRTLGSPFQKHMPLLKIHDRVSEAKKDIEKMALVRIANDIAFDKLSDGAELNDFARILGISPDNNDPAVVRQLVIKKAQSNPKEFTDKYQHANKEYLTIIARAKAANLIRFSINSGFVYADKYPLGMTEIAAIAHLKEHNQLTAQINAESKNVLEETGIPEPEINLPKTTKEEPQSVVQKAEEVDNTMDNVTDNNTGLNEDDAKTIENSGGNSSPVTELVDNEFE